MSGVVARILEIFTVYRTVKARARALAPETPHARRAAPRPLALRPRRRAPHARERPTDRPGAAQMVKIHDKKLILVHQVR